MPKSSSRGKSRLLPGIVMLERSERLRAEYLDGRTRERTKLIRASLRRNDDELETGTIESFNGEFRALVADQFTDMKVIIAQLFGRYGSEGRSIDGGMDHRRVAPNSNLRRRWATVREFATKS